MPSELKVLEAGIIAVGLNESVTEAERAHNGGASETLGSVFLNPQIL
jgi:hypothetical protein